MKFYIGNSLAFLLLIFLPFIVYLSRRSLAGLSSFRHKLALFLRIILVLLLILALAEIQLVVKSKLLTVLYLLDVSKSVPAHAKEQAIEFIHRSMKKMKPKKDQASLLVFGKDASFEFLNEKNDDNFDSIQSQVNIEQTDIAGAIKLAIAGLPEIGQRRIVLISDGNETVGKALIEAEKCRSQNVTLDVVPITFATDKEVLVEKLVGPPEVHEGQAYEVIAVIRSQRDTTGRIHFFIGDQKVFERKVTLKKGKNSITIPIPGKLVKAGFQKLKVIIDSQDDYIASNNMGETFSYIRGVPRVLFIDPNPNHRQFLYRALTKKVSKKQKITVMEGTIADIPRDILTLHSYDSLILSNVSRDYLKKGQMRLIESAIKESGMGFIMIGGEASFGAGGYKDTPIEKALPVTMDIRHKKIIPNGALAIVLHTCEFAQGNLWGKRISKKAIDVLSPQDLAGVLLYSWRPRGSGWLFPLQPVTNKAQMKRLIDNSNAGDMPSFGPTLNAAVRGLSNAKAGKKHILIITDGDPSVPDRGIIKRLQRAKISVSIVVIRPHGGGDINMMKLICSATGGTYYRVNNPKRLPSIFVKEALITKRNLIFEDEKGIAPIMAYSSEPLKGIGAGEIPSIYGYVLTSAKTLAKVPIHIQADKDQKDPLFAHIQYGLGRTVAFTSDAKNRWGNNWVNWSKFDKFWLQTVRWSLRKVDQSKFKVASFTSGGKGKVAIDAVTEKGEFINFLQMQGILILPSGHSRPFNVRQKGPGRYEGQFPIDEVGTYLINVGYKYKGRFRNLTTGLSVSFSSEYLATKANVPLLKQIAEVSGGRVIRYSFMDRDNDGNIAQTEWEGTLQKFKKLDQDQSGYISQDEHKSQEEIFLHDKPRGGYPTDLWPIFLVIFLVLFPIDVFIRRVLIDYGKLWASFMSFLKREKKQEESTTTMNRLFQKKSSLGKSLRRGKSKSLDLANLEKLGRSTGVSEEETSTTSGPSSTPKLAPKAEKKPPKKEEPEAEDYTSRLLAAKKKTWEKKKRKDP